MNKTYIFNPLYWVLVSECLFTIYQAQEVALTSNVLEEENGHYTFGLVDGGFVVAF